MAHHRGRHPDRLYPSYTYVRGFSRRLPEDPTISPRVQKAWPRKSCIPGQKRPASATAFTATPPPSQRAVLDTCSLSEVQGPVRLRHLREPGLAGQSQAELTCLDKSGLLESTSYLQGTQRNGRGRQGRSHRTLPGTLSRVRFPGGALGALEAPPARSL